MKGRVLSSESEAATMEPGLYVVGWLKRGPTGIVATNLHCAEETVCTFVLLFSTIVLQKICKHPIDLSVVSSFHLFLSEKHLQISPEVA